ADRRNRAVSERQVQQHREHARRDLAERERQPAPGAAHEVDDGQNRDAARPHAAFILSKVVTVFHEATKSSKPAPGTQHPAPSTSTHHPPPIARHPSYPLPP